MLLDNMQKKGGCCCCLLVTRWNIGTSQTKPQIVSWTYCCCWDVV